MTSTPTYHDKLKGYDEELLPDGSTLFLAGPGVRDIGTVSGNPWHDPASGKFADGPPGVKILRGAISLRDLPNVSKHLIDQRRAFTNPDGITADRIGNQTTIHLFKGPTIVGKFDVPAVEPGSTHDVPHPAINQAPMPPAPNAPRPDGDYTRHPDLQPQHRLQAPGDFMQRFDALRHMGAQIDQKLKNGDLTPQQHDDLENASFAMQRVLASYHREAENMQRLLTARPKDEAAVHAAFPQRDHQVVGERIASTVAAAIDTLPPQDDLGTSMYSYQLNALISAIIASTGMPGVHDGHTEIKTMPHGQHGVAHWGDGVSFSPEVATAFHEATDGMRIGMVDNHHFQAISSVFHEAHHQGIAKEARDVLKRHYGERDALGMFLEEGLVEHQARHGATSALETSGVEIHGTHPLSRYADSHIHPYQEEFSWVQGVHHDITEGLVRTYGMDRSHAEEASLGILKQIHHDVGHKYDRLRALDAWGQRLGFDMKAHTEGLPGESVATHHFWQAPNERKINMVGVENLGNIPNTGFSPRRFPTQDHATMWADEHWGNDWVPHLSQEESDMLQLYKGDGSSMINGWLRRDPRYYDVHADSGFDTSHLVPQASNYETQLKLHAWMQEHGPYLYHQDRRSTPEQKLVYKGPEHAATAHASIREKGLLRNQHGANWLGSQVLYTHQSEYRGNPQYAVDIRKLDWSKFKEAHPNAAVRMRDEPHGPYHPFITANYEGDIPQHILEDFTGYHGPHDHNLRPPNPKPKTYVEDHVTHLDAALDKTATPDDVHVWRKGKMPDGIYSPEKLVGMGLHDEGYWSTSLDPNVAKHVSGYSPVEHDDVIYRISLPKGSKAGWMEHFDDGSHPESELLLPRGTTISVDSFEGMDEHGRPIYHASLAQSRPSVHELARMLAQHFGTTNDDGLYIQFPNKFSQKWLEQNIHGLTNSEYMHLKSELQARNWSDEEIKQRVTVVKLNGMAGDFAGDGPKLVHGVNGLEVGDHFVTEYGKVGIVTKHTGYSAQGEELQSGDKLFLNHYSSVLKLEHLGGVQAEHVPTEPPIPEPTPQLPGADYQLPVEDVTKLYHDIGYHQGHSGKGLLAAKERGSMKYNDAGHIHGAITHTEMHAAVSAGWHEANGLKPGSAEPHVAKEPSVEMHHEPGAVIHNEDLGAGLTYVGPAGGTTGATWYTDSAGQHWLVKKGDKNRLATEAASNAIYRELGADVAESYITTVQGEDALVSKRIAGVPLMTGSNMDANEAIRAHFMDDVLLANWDVAGTGFDNIFKGDDGTFYRLDHGGTLRYRAQGGLKDFGPIPSEHKTLLDPNVNPYSAKVFEKLTEADMAEQADHIAKTLTNEKIHAAVESAGFSDPVMKDDVIKSLKARRDWMKQYAEDHADVAKVQSAAPHTPSVPLYEVPIGGHFQSGGEEFYVTAWGNPGSMEIYGKSVESGADAVFYGDDSVKHLTHIMPEEGVQAAATEQPNTTTAGQLKVGDKFKDAFGNEMSAYAKNAGGVTASSETGATVSYPNDHKVEITLPHADQWKTEELPAETIQVHQTYSLGSLPFGTEFSSSKLGENKRYTVGAESPDATHKWAIDAEGNPIILHKTLNVKVHKVPSPAGEEPVTIPAHGLQKGDIFVMEGMGQIYQVDGKNGGFLTLTNTATGGSVSTHEQQFENKVIKVIAGPSFDSKGKSVESGLTPGKEAKLGDLKKGDKFSINDPTHEGHGMLFEHTGTGPGGNVGAKDLIGEEGIFPQHLNTIFHSGPSEDSSKTHPLQHMVGHEAKGSELKAGMLVSEKDGTYNVVQPPHASGLHLENVKTKQLKIGGVVPKFHYKVESVEGVPVHEPGTSYPPSSPEHGIGHGTGDPSDMLGHAHYAKDLPAGTIAHDPKTNTTYKIMSHNQYGGTNLREVEVLDDGTIADDVADSITIPSDTNLVVIQTAGGASVYGKPQYGAPVELASLKPGDKFEHFPGSTGHGTGEHIVNNVTDSGNAWAYNHEGSMKPHKKQVVKYTGSGPKPTTGGAGNVSSLASKLKKPDDTASEPKLPLGSEHPFSDIQSGTIVTSPDAGGGMWEVGEQVSTHGTPGVMIHGVENQGGTWVPTGEDMHMYHTTTAKIVEHPTSETSSVVNAASTRVSKKVSDLNVGDEFHYGGKKDMPTGTYKVTGGVDSQGHIKADNIADGAHTIHHPENVVEVSQQTAEQASALGKEVDVMADGLKVGDVFAHDQGYFKVKAVAGGNYTIEDMAEPGQTSVVHATDLDVVHVVSGPSSGAPQSQPVAKKLTDVQIGSTVIHNGVEHEVGQPAGTSSVSLIHHAADGTQSENIVHHKTQVGVLNEGTGDTVGKALPYSYDLPPKILKGWIQLHVPLMTEKQFSHFLSVLKSKNWSTSEIDQKIMPFWQKAGAVSADIGKALGYIVDPHTGAKRFVNHTAGDGWAKTVLGNFGTKLKGLFGESFWHKAKSAFHGYFDGTYTQINSSLRVNNRTAYKGSAYAAQIDAMKQAFTQAPKTPEDVMIFRRTQWPVPIHEGQALVGRYVRDKGFMSCSYMENSWHGHVAKLHLPAGTPMIWANGDSMSGHPGEKEILLNAGSVFRIDAVVSEGGTTKMVLRYVGNDLEGWKLPPGGVIYGSEQEWMDDIQLYEAA